MTNRSDLRIKHLSLRNWMTIRSAELDFPDAGLVLVLGSNLMAGGKLDSVGAGKSSVGEALSRVLLGVPGRYSTFGHYSPRGGGDTYLKLDTELRGTALTVEAGFKCPELSKSGEGLRYQLAGQEPIERGAIRETRAELANLLGVGPALAEWTVNVDGDKLRFNKMSERDSVGLLMNALRQPPWDDLSKRAAKMLNDAKTTRQGAEERLATAKATAQRTQESLKTAQTSVAVEEQRLQQEKVALGKRLAEAKKALKARESAITTLTRRQQAIKVELQGIEASVAKALEALTKEKREYDDGIAREQDERSLLVEKRATLLAQYNTAKAALDEMLAVPAACPTCGKAWDKAHGAEEVEKQTKSVNDLVAKWQEAEDAVACADNRIQAIRSILPDLDQRNRAAGQKDTVNALAQEYSQNEGTLAAENHGAGSLRLNIQTLEQGPSTANLERWKAVVDERTTQAAEAKTTVETVAEELAQAQELVKVVSYWNEAFGPSGIPNMILSDAIAPLNEISKRLSALMTNSTLSIVYDTSRTLATGRATAELVIKVENSIGGSRIEGSSKGEAGLTNLILAETLSEVGMIPHRVGYRWFDEVLSNQDEVVRRSILTYLKEMAARLGILIFIVDHDKTVANFADHVLLAEKGEQGTVLSWA